MSKIGIDGRLESLGSSAEHGREVVVCCGR